MTNSDPSPADQSSAAHRLASGAELGALHDCTHLAVIALKHAANSEPVECGRTLVRLELASFPHSFASRAYLLSVYIEAFAVQQWIRSRATRPSLYLPTERSPRAHSSST